jgi:hypothetical protein
MGKSESFPDFIGFRLERIRRLALKAGGHHRGQYTQNDEDRYDFDEGEASWGAGIMVVLMPAGA